MAAQHERFAAQRFGVVATLAAVMAWCSIVAGPVQGQTAHPKSARVATALSAVIPGAGQMYGGAPRRGALLLALTAGSFVAGRSLRNSRLGNCPFGDRVESCLDSADRMFYAGFGVALASYAFAVYDAHRIVRRTNAKRAPGLAAADGVRLRVVASPRVVGLGLSLR